MEKCKKLEFIENLVSKIAKRCLFVQRFMNQFRFWQVDMWKFKSTKKENTVLQNSTSVCLHYFICNRLKNCQSLFFWIWKVQIVLFTFTSETKTTNLISNAIFKISKVDFKYFFVAIINVIYFVHTMHMIYSCIIYYFYMLVIEVSFWFYKVNKQKS